MTGQLLPQIDALKDRARFFAGQRRKDADLYAVLGACLTLCEEIVRDRREADLREAVAAKAKGGRNRTYVEQGTDVYVTLCRYVFEGEEQRRDATWRYGAALREAAKRQVRGVDLAAWLAENGGIRALFLARPVEARSLSTKTLHLTSPVTAPKDGTFSVTLRYNGAGAFDVVAQGGVP